ncbi:MAG: hypothetical protein WCS43_09100 [Verrucomicrobiota bacterium]
MIPRALPILNALGCLALTGLVVAQWMKERSIHKDLTVVTRQLADAKDETAKETQRRAILEHDIAVLKEAIESTQKAAESTTRELSEKSTLATGLQTELSAAREQVTQWEAAIKARDERIQSLTGDLAATRKRLDEAIAKLKAAAAK